MIVPQLTTTASKPTPDNAKTFTVTNPESGKVVHHVHSATLEDIDEAITTCYATRAAWRDTLLEKRIEVILKAAELIEDESSGWKKRVLDANRAETSINDWWSAIQLDEIVTDGMKKLVSKATEALAQEIIDEHDSTIKITREPYGVCLAMAPWNTVQPLLMRAVVTPLLAGNTVVLKTSEYVPYSQYLWAELLYEAGLVPGALCVVHVSTQDAPVLVKRLILDQRVRHVNFTGSSRMGSIIAGLAGQSLKPVVMELGGKAPAVILQDADLETAASHLLFGAFHNAGQICMGTERAIVPLSKQGELEKLLREAWNKNTARGKTRGLFTLAAATRAAELINDAKYKGARDILESAREDERNAVVQPRVLSPLVANMRFWTEESFAPILGIITVDDRNKPESQVIEEMVEIANASEYGLSASVWSKDIEKAQNVASRLECGAVHINSPTPADPALVPHGGWKSSGFGRFNSIDGIRGFTQTRAIEIPKGPSKPLPLEIFGL